MDRAVVVGNCQAKALELTLATNDAFAQRFELVSFPAVHEIPDAMVPELHAAVAGAALVATQRVDEGYRDGIGLGTETLARIAGSATVVRWPSVYWAGYVPDLFYLRDEAGGPVVDGPFDYHDRTILEAYASGLGVADACALLADPDRPSDAVAWAEAATAELATRGRDCDVDVAAFIAERFRDQLLFYTMNHPSNALLGHMADQLLALLGLPGGADLTRMPGEVLGSTFYPLHARHARVLGLRFGDDLVAGSAPFRIRGVAHAPADAVAAFYAYYDAHPDLVALNRAEPAEPRRADGPRCFMHVPKSAGSSVREALAAALPEGALAPQRHDDVNLSPFRDFDALAPALRAAVVTNERELLGLAEYEVVCGHFVLPSLLRIARPELIATIVREPRARLLSLYAYWAVGDFSAAAPYDAWRHASLPLGEFLSTPTIAPVVDNQLCRMLLHGDPRLPLDGFVAPEDVEELADESLRRLGELGFVGIQELPERMWSGLSEVFGAALAPARANVTAAFPGTPRCPPIAESIDAPTLALLARRTAVDGRVYRALVVEECGAGADPDLLASASFLRQVVELGALLRDDATVGAAVADDEGAVAHVAPDAAVRHPSHQCAPASPPSPHGAT